MRAVLIRLVGLSLLILLPLLSVQADIVAVTSFGNVGQFTSQAIVNGNPAISYLDTSISVLRYVQAADASGTTWNPPTVADGTVGTGLFTSLAVVNGNPAISYYDSVNGNLMFVRATDVNGGTWNPFPALVDSGSGDDVGLYTSLAVVNGNPAISYYDATNQTLRYVRATDASGTTWGSPIVVDTGAVGRFTSLAVVAGNPAISYYDVTNGDLRYVRATDVNGTAWGAPIGVSTATDVGQYTSLAVVNGFPAISFYNVTNGDLLYVRATDATGSAWSIPLGPDVTGNVGSHTSLFVVNGNPAISYYDGTNQALKFTRALNANGTSWSIPTTFTVDTLGGTFTSLVVANGNPAISYYDSTNADLRFARACDANGTSWLVSCAATITLEFASAASNAAEAAGFGNLLRVTTSDTNPTATAVTVTVSVTGGTATAADYNLTGTITIPAGTAHNSLVSIASGITVTNETLIEANETVNLQLSAPSGAVLGAQIITIHTINDDDTVPVVVPPVGGGNTNTTTSTTNSAAPQIAVFDPAISKLGFLLPGQLGAQGEQLEWVVTVSNVGGATGNNIIVTDTLRPELKIDRVTAPDGTVNISGQTVSVTFATIQPGQTFQFSIFTTVTAGVTVDNTACVQAAGIATECTTAPAVSSLPSTGEMPQWATLLRGLVVVILVGSGLWVLSRQLRLNAKQE